MRRVLAGLAGLVMLSAPVCDAQARDSMRAVVAERDFAWMDTLPLLRFNPPVTYLLWRAKAERCSGWRRDGWPTLYVTNRELLVTPDGLAAALFSQRSGSVVFALGQEMRAHIVVHELLHWLGEAQTAPPPAQETDAERHARQHPPEVFERRCREYLTREE